MSVAAGAASGLISFVVGRLIWDVRERHTRRMRILAALGADCAGTIKAFRWTLEELRSLEKDAARFAQVPTLKLALQLSRSLTMYPPQFDPVTTAVDLKPAEAILAIRYVDRWHGFITSEAVYRSTLHAFVADPVASAVSAQILASRVRDALKEMMADTLAALLTAADLFECARRAGALSDEDVRQLPDDLRASLSSLDKLRLQWAAALLPLQ